MTTHAAAAAHAMLLLLCACAAPTSVLVLLNADLVMSINVFMSMLSCTEAGCL